MIVIMVVVMIVFIVIMILVFHRGEVNGLALLNHFQHEIRIHVIPRRRNDPGVRMHFGNQETALFHPVRRQQLRPAENHGGRALHLIQEELPEVFHIHPAFARVHNRGAAADFNIRVPFLRLLHGGKDLAQLSDAGRLHQNPIRMIGVNQLIDRRLKISRQGAADAARVQFRHSDSRILHKTAVNADFTVLILQQHHFFPAQAAGQQLPDQRRLSRTQKT